MIAILLGLVAIVLIWRSGFIPTIILLTVIYYLWCSIEEHGGWVW